MTTKELRNKLSKIEKDCLRLKREKQLTEFGLGQYELVKQLKSDLTLFKGKYSIRDLRKIPIESRIAASNLIIANELNAIVKLLSKKNNIPTTKK